MSWPSGVAMPVAPAAPGAGSRLSSTGLDGRPRTYPRVESVISDTASA
jgi:hypothetical protein